LSCFARLVTVFELFAARQQGHGDSNTEILLVQNESQITAWHRITVHSVGLGKKWHSYVFRNNCRFVSANAREHTLICRHFADTRIEILKWQCSVSARLWWCINVPCSEKHSNSLAYIVITILFYFIFLFYFILFHFISFYFILFHFILFYFIILIYCIWSLTSLFRRKSEICVIQCLLFVGCVLHETVELSSQARDESTYFFLNRKDRSYVVSKRFKELWSISRTYGIPATYPYMNIVT